MIRRTGPPRPQPRPYVVLLPALALALAGFLGCGEDDASPGGPTIDLRPLTVILSLVRGIDILEGEAAVTGYGGSHRFPWGRHSSSGNTTVSVVEDRFSTWQFDVEGRLIVEDDTTGLGLLYTHTRDVDMSAIGDTLGVRLDLVTPRLTVENTERTARLSWHLDVPRAISYELRQIRPGHPDSVFTSAAADTTIPWSAITDPRRYQVRAVLRDGRVSAYSIPVDLSP